MLIGVIAGLTTCALWGLTFVAPRAVAPFTAVDLTVARYAVFGTVSAALMLHGRFRPSGFGPGRIAVGLLLGGCGYVGYFMAVAEAVRLAGPTLPPIVVGTMPVVLPLVAGRGRQGVPWRVLGPALAAVACGIAVVDAGAMAAQGRASPPAPAPGLAWAGAALLLWVAYGAINGAVMQSRDPPDALRWTGLQGLGAMLGSAALLPFAARDLGGISTADLLRFAAWAAVMGIAASWLATLCWAVAARRLPVALAAQLIVAETLFGLLFGLAFEARWPSTAESVGCALQVAGVAAAIVGYGRCRGSRAAPTACSRDRGGTVAAEREGSAHRGADAPVSVRHRSGFS